MKKKIIAAAFLTFSIIGTVVYAHSTAVKETTNNPAPADAVQVVKEEGDFQKLSEEEVVRMAQIVQDVNAGKLPESALKEAQPLLDRKQYNKIAK